MAPAFSIMATNPKKLPLFSSNLSSKHSSRPIHVLCVTASSQKQQCRWSSVDRDIKTHILESLPSNLHPSIEAPMHYLLSSAPPTIAPALCLTACDLVGGQREQAIAAASCLQLMHAAFHTHSRLLAGRPGKFPPGIELMTGDGIIPLGYEMVTSLRSETDAERVLRAVIEIASATGARGVEELVRERKEGRMLSCAAACGAILGGGTDEEVERMRRFGLLVAMARAESTSAVDAEAAFLSLARLELRGFERAEELLNQLVGYSP